MIAFGSKCLRWAFSLWKSEVFEILYIFRRWIGAFLCWLLVFFLNHLITFSFKRFVGLQQILEKRTRILHWILGLGIMFLSLQKNLYVWGGCVWEMWNYFYSEVYFNSMEFVLWPSDLVDNYWNCMHIVHVTFKELSVCILKHIVSWLVNFGGYMCLKEWKPFRGLTCFGAIELIKTGAKVMLKNCVQKLVSLWNLNGNLGKTYPTTMNWGNIYFAGYKLWSFF